MLSAVACAHCGNPCPPGPDDRISSGHEMFCCRGCHAVFELLKLRGLGRYYDLKRLTGVLRKPQPVTEVPADFQYLSHPEFVTLYGSPDESGSAISATPASPATKMRFFLEGVHCAACVWLVEKLPEFVEGVESARLDFSSSVATVKVADASLLPAVAREFHALGYRPHPVRDGEEEELLRRENRGLLIRTGVAAACAGNIMLLAVSLYGGAVDQWGELFRWVSFALYLPVIFYSAIPFYRNAWAALRARSISIDVSIVLAIFLGSLASIWNLLAPKTEDGTYPHIYFDSLAVFVFLLLGSRYLLRRAQQAALDSSHLLRFLAPAVARRIIGESDGEGAKGRFDEVPVEALRAGDLIEVRAGETLPADGVIVSGRSSIDRSLLTGESSWVEVANESAVFAGTVNCEAPLQVKVTQAGPSSRLGRILQAAAEGATRKARIVEIADRIAKVFVVVTLGLSGGALFWTLWQGGALQDGINRALAVVIVACPCALALATPLAMTVGIGRAARNGILIRGADVVEKLIRAKTVFLDKTGTLTEGRFEVLEWNSEPAEPREPETESEEGAREIQLAALALERGSNHALARALVRYLSAKFPRELVPEVSDFREFIGRGVEGRVNGSFYEIRQIKDASSEIDSASIGTASGSRIGVYRDGRLVARVLLGDTLRKDSAFAVGKLRELGLRVRVLSGDSASVVRQTAMSLGISPEKDAFFEVSPEEKARIVSEDSQALMVGDGANDAVALASATVGVAVRGGVEVSMRSADAYLNAEGVMPLHRLLIEARETVKVVRRNIAFSLAYNIVGVYAALAGWVDPLVAAVVMPMSAFTVLGSTIIGTRVQRKALQEGSPP